MRYSEYDRWLQGEYRKIDLEPGCSHTGPSNIPTLHNGKPPWNMDWCVRFPDGKHFKVKERWSARPIRLGGQGYRKHFAFHYGYTNPVLDAGGYPVKDEANYPTILRIDHDPYGPHLHYGGENHVFQDRVRNFNISDADMFVFIRAVIEHRATGEEFSRILGFEVTR